jgi:hypothetical protein
MEAIYRKVVSTCGFDLRAMGLVTKRDMRTGEIRDGGGPKPLGRRAARNAR